MSEQWQPIETAPRDKSILAGYWKLRRLGYAITQHHKNTLMTNLAALSYPDWVSPPGETITDLLEEKKWTQLELAERLGYTTKHLNQLVKGEVPLTEDAALRLERVLGSTVNFWLNREAKYREHLARFEA